MEISAHAPSTTEAEHPATLVTRWRSAVLLLTMLAILAAFADLLVAGLALAGQMRGVNGLVHIALLGIAVAAAAVAMQSWLMERMLRAMLSAAVAGLLRGEASLRIRMDDIEVRYLLLRRDVDRTRTRPEVRRKKRRHVTPGEALAEDFEEYLREHDGGEPEEDVDDEDR